MSTNLWGKGSWLKEEFYSQLHCSSQGHENLRKLGTQVYLGWLLKAHLYNSTDLKSARPLPGRVYLFSSLDISLGFLPSWHELFLLCHAFLPCYPAAKPAWTLQTVSISFSSLKLSQQYDSAMRISNI